MSFVTISLSVYQHMIQLHSFLEGKLKYFFGLFLPSRNRSNKSKLNGFMAIAALLLLNAVLFFVILRYDISFFKSAGYIGLFISVFLGSAVAFLPLPIGVIILSYFFILNPIMVALVGGLAAALGSIGPYLVGRQSKEFFRDYKWYQKLHAWLEQKPKLLMIFLASFIPNPLFDTVTVTSGILEVPVKRYFVAVFAGKAAFYVIAASVLPYLPIVSSLVANLQN